MGSQRHWLLALEGRLAERNFSSSDSSLGGDAQEMLR